MTVTDEGTLFDTADVTINLTNENEAPVVNNITFTIAENLGTGENVGLVAASDPDAGTTLTWTITGGNASGAFAIDPATGEITVANSTVLDFDTTPSFLLEVTVTDEGTLFDTADVTINLTNENEAPVVNNITFTIAENLGTGENVGPVAASDPDAGTTLTWTITGGNASGAFAIDPATGQITVANSTVLDFDTTPSFLLEVTVTDEGTLFDTADVTINLTNVNEAPVVNNITFTIAENRAPGRTSAGGGQRSGRGDDADLDDHGRQRERGVRDRPGHGPDHGGQLDRLGLRHHAQLPARRHGDRLGHAVRHGRRDDQPDERERSAGGEQHDVHDRGEPGHRGERRPGGGQGSGRGDDADLDDHGRQRERGVRDRPGHGPDHGGQLDRFDFETTPSFLLDVTVTDEGTLFDTADVTINLTNVNEAPVVNNITFTSRRTWAPGRTSARWRPAIRTRGRR